MWQIVVLTNHYHCVTMLARHYISVELLQKQVHNHGCNSRTVAMPQGECSPEQNSNTVDCRYSSSLKYGHLDIPAIWFGTDC